ncbi:MAG: hypothetical protein L0154_21405 [Chloroflexi bacterium]|nr:hypothetical protein [Chloroflexota bacterium]
MVATIIGLAADVQDLIGGGDGAELVVEDFGAALSTNQRTIEAQVVVHNQGEDSADDVSVGIVVSVNGTSDTISPADQSVESIVPDTSRTFNFSIDVSAYGSGTTFLIKAQIMHDDDTIESSTLQLIRR